MYRFILLLTVLLTHPVCLAAAQETTVQDADPAGQKIANPLLGISFTAPKGWNVEELGSGYNVYHPEQKRNLIIIASTYSTRDELFAVAREPIDDGQGTRLAVTGEPLLFSDNGVLAEYTGTWRGEAARVAAIGLPSPYGGSVMILSVSDRSEAGDTNKTLAQNLARSVSFLVQDEPNGSQALQLQLAGKKLTYLSSYGSGTSGGYSSQRFISLCPDGTFFLRGNSSVSMEVSGGFGNSSGIENARGLWKVTAAAGRLLLVLTGTDGSISQFEITTDRNALHLDGRRYGVTADVECE